VASLSFAFGFSAGSSKTLHSLHANERDDFERQILNSSSHVQRERESPADYLADCEGI
jgi:hypothetical protein